MVRILLAGVLGGLAVFICGAVEHMVFRWGEPKALKGGEAALVEVIKAQQLEPDLYYFPGMPATASEDEKQKYNDRYKQGPAGLVLIAPPGEDMMPPWKLIFEGLANIGFALIAAWIVSFAAPGTNLYTRWLIVLFMGLAAWLSIEASYGIWYRYPWTYVREQLYCALFESGVGGLVIAAIVKPAKAPAA